MLPKGPREGSSEPAHITREALRTHVMIPHAFSNIFRDKLYGRVTSDGRDVIEVGDIEATCEDLLPKELAAKLKDEVQRELLEWEENDKRKSGAADRI